jgi:hypothetical protein
MSNVQLFGFDDTNKQFNPVHINASGALSTTASINTTGLASSAAQTDGSQISKIRGDDSGTSRDVQVDSNGKLNVNAAIADTVAVSGTFFQTTQPVSAAALPLPSGAATSAAQTDGSQVAKMRGDDSGTSRDVQVDVNGKLNVNAAISGTVTVDGSGSTQPVSGTFFQATQPVSGTVGVSGTVTVDGSGSTQPVSGTFFQATQPVSAVSLPLPTGAATETSLAAVAACINGANALQVDIQADGVSLATQSLQTAGNSTLTGIETGIDELNENAFTTVQESVASLSTTRGTALNCTNYSTVQLLVDRDSTSTATGVTHLQLQWSATGTGDWVYPDFYQSIAESFDVDGTTGSQYNVRIMSEVKNKYVRYAIYNADGSTADILNVNLARIH